MSKMIKCKSCGAEIAKTANRCPHCGARQHQVALTACYLIVILTAVIIFFIIRGEMSNPENPGDVPGSNQISETAPPENGSSVIFTGEYAEVSYLGAAMAPGVEGCFYLNLHIENTSETNQTVYLSDVYVDDLACNSGSGAPVNVNAEKKRTAVTSFSLMEI